MLRFVYPFVFTERRIEGTSLNRLKLQREPWSQFLQSHFLLVLEQIHVMTKEDEITLIVKRDHVPALVLWIVRKQGG